MGGFVVRVAHLCRRPTWLMPVTSGRIKDSSQAHARAKETFGDIRASHPIQRKPLTAGRLAGQGCREMWVLRRVRSLQVSGESGKETGFFMNSLRLRSLTVVLVCVWGLPPLLAQSQSQTSNAQAAPPAGSNQPAKQNTPATPAAPQQAPTPANPFEKVPQSGAGTTTACGSDARRSAGNQAAIRASLKRQAQ